jgi:transcription-repair coupling factor (superfamily II helicase)
MRDLEIRGAGNFIGGEQHGHLAAIGFSLYVRMLKEAVQELRGETVEETVEPTIDVQVKALLPMNISLTNKRKPRFTNEWSPSTVRRN